MCEFDDGHVVLAPVRMGKGSVLEVRASLDGGASLGEDACVTALSIVTMGHHVPRGERWDGIPAKRSGVVGPRPAIDCGGEALSPFAHAVMLIGLRTLGAWAGFLPSFLVTAALLHAAGDAEGLRAWLADPSVGADSIWMVGLSLALAVIAALVLQGVAMRFGPRAPAGVHRTRSAMHVITTLRTNAVDLAGFWLAGTLFWPWWLRLAGARVGPKSEISTIIDVLPEQVSIGGPCFLADGIYLGGPRIDRGTVEVRPIHLGVGTFVGNHAVIPAGVHMPDGVLMGVSTVADDKRMAKGTSWFGHPQFELPRREVIAMDASLTYKPNLLRWTNRLFWEVLRFSVPVVPAVGFVWWAESLAPFAETDPAVWLWHAPLASLAFAWGLAGLVLALKWLLLGRVKPGQHAMWSCWVGRWDFHYVAWEMLSRHALMRLSGTLLLAWYLRAIGVKVGKGVVLGNGFAQVVDPDMITIGDGATVDTMFQAHSFEDRVLKMDLVNIGARATPRLGRALRHHVRRGLHRRRPQRRDEERTAAAAPRIRRRPDAPRALIERFAAVAAHGCAAEGACECGVCASSGSLASAGCRRERAARCRPSAGPLAARGCRDGRGARNAMQCEANCDRSPRGVQRGAIGCAVRTSLLPSVVTAYGNGSSVVAAPTRPCLSTASTQKLRR